MRSTRIRNTVLASVAALLVMVGANAASAQANREYRDWQRAQQEAQREHREYLRTRNSRDYREWQQAQREAQREYRDYQQERREDIRDNRREARRYRIYRNGRYYQTDNRGAELLRQAVNRGYQQGYRAGQNDRRYRRGSNYYNDTMYRRGNYGYQSYVDSSQYQYYFREGFGRGYQDGYNSQVRYGYNSGGTLNILGTILNQILNIREF